MNSLTILLKLKPPIQQLIGQKRVARHYVAPRSYLGKSGRNHYDHQSPVPGESGTKAVKASNRSANWAGPNQNIKTALLNNGQGAYYVEVWVGPLRARPMYTLSCSIMAARQHHRLENNSQRYLHQHRIDKGIGDHRPELQRYIIGGHVLSGKGVRYGRVPLR
jgi:hypothetical protein